MAEPLWSFVTPDKRKVLRGAARENARSSIRNLFNWMHRSHETSSFSIDAELGTVPSHILDTAAPVPDWKEAADSFLRSLKQWEDEHNGGLLRPVAHRATRKCHEPDTGACRIAGRIYGLHESISL